MTSSTRKDAIVVTGVGLVSSLGLGWKQSCASAWAGVSRIGELDYLSEDEDSLEMVPVVGHSASFVSEGFTDVGRLIRLSSLALKDLFESENLSSGIVKDCAVVINVSSWFHKNAVDKFPITDPTVEISVKPDEEMQAWYSQLFQNNIVNALDTPEIPISTQLIFGDDAGFVHGLQVASEMLNNRKVRYVLLGAVDSLVDQPNLKNLDALDLIKVAGKADGLIPGEASGFFLLETFENAKKQNSYTFAMIGAHSYARDQVHRFSMESVVGNALSLVIKEVLNNISLDDINTLAVVGNTNGDFFRAKEWGHTVVKLSPRLSLENYVSTAEYFGDVRAASGVVGMVLALSRYVLDERICCLVWASADSGTKGAVTLFPSVA